MPLVRSRASSHVTLLLAVLALLAATLVPSSPAAAADTGWDSDNACPSSVPSSGFTDAPGIYQNAIDCLAWFQLTSGQTATTYGTSADLRRDQTASFVVRVMERVDEVEVPTRQANAFPDVDSGPHLVNIETLAGADPAIVAGFDDGTFRPGLPVTRAQFATIVTRMLDELASQGLIDRLPNATNTFADTRGSVHEDNVARLANAGIVLGRSSSEFAPNQSINRGQVALMITRILGGLVERDLVLQPLQLTGTVHEATDVRPDELGPRLSGATVSVEGVASSSTTTANDGTYSLWVQQPGVSELTVEAAGFVDRAVPLDLPDENVAGGLDVGMYRAATAPANSVRTTSTPADVRITADGNFWVIGLGFSAQDADEIVLEYPNGIAIELGDAGTDDAWFSRNADGTSNRFGEWGGTHTVYYRVDGAWLRLDARFAIGDGRLAAVNGLTYPPPAG